MIYNLAANDPQHYSYVKKVRYIMSAKFTAGQRVRIVRIDDIPYGLKYSYLEATIDKTGVIQEYDAQSSRYIVRLDEDGSLLSLTENALEEAE